MDQTIFYQSSLPRAGSTLLQNLLGQNPLIYPTSTSSLINLVLGARKGYNVNPKSTQEEIEMWKKGFYAFCREGLKGYAKTLTDRPYIVDKSRGWAPHYSLLNEITPNPKILVMVRDLRDIFASLEKRFRQTPDFDDGSVDGYKMQNITTFQRVKTYATTPPLGNSIERLHQSFLDKTSRKFLFIRYEDLCTNPEQELRRIYEYLELEYYQHDFSYIPQITFDNDANHGIYGEHTIRNTLEMLPQDYEDVLSKATCDWIYDNYKEYFKIFKYPK
jgi:sulfotransferase